MPDYKQLIDEQTRAFIEKTERLYPPDTFNRPLAEQRRIYDTMCRTFFHSYPAGVTADDFAINGVDVRRYRLSADQSPSVILYFHGGGFSLGGLESHDDVCAEICGATGIEVIAVDYRLMPEFAHPAQVIDCQTVLDWARKERGGTVILVGDSAGGYLASEIAKANCAARDIIGQVLIYPGFGVNQPGGSMDEHAFAPLLTRAEVLGVVTEEPSYGNLTGLPPSIVFSAECDPLSDSGRNYAAAVKSAGGEAYWFLDHGLVHGHLRARHSAERAGQCFQRILQAIRLIEQGNSKDITALL